jgi:hypothetical protein
MNITANLWRISSRQSRAPVGADQEASMSATFRNVFRKQKIAYLVLLIAFICASTSGCGATIPTGGADASDPGDGADVYLPSVMNKPASSGCSQTGLGAILLTEQTSGESTGPYLVQLTQVGHTGLAAAPAYSDAAEYFHQLQGWDRALICNSHDCLQTKAQRAANEDLSYEYLAYDPERLEGVPDEEKYNLLWATQVARQIADQWNTKLIISYSTVQLHQEAEERGYDWNDPSAIVSMLAPYGDLWLIQAADEYWRLEDGTVRPVLSQRVYPPGPEFRNEVERWVNWIKAANPDIKIWIQLALQRIGVQGENEPSAELLLEYRDSIVDLVDGIYIMPNYGSLEQFPDSNQEMATVFQRACQAQPFPAEENSHPVENERSFLAFQEISLIEEGWTDDLNIPCPPEGDCITILPGYYYRIYENDRYPCGLQGNHQFMVLDQNPDSDAYKNLFVKFLGGAVGFWYLDSNQNRAYYPNERAAGLLTASNNWNMFFRTSVSEEYANGVTKKFRQNSSFRILVPSYCSHDLYHGRGEYDQIDGFNRWGYLAAMEAVDYVQEHFNTDQIITYGGSAGAAGAFYIGKDQDNVAGIIMDSQAVDLSAISEACEDGYNVFGGAYPCFCPENGPTCMQVLAPKIGFTFSQDEPYRFFEQGLSVPIYFVWNENDASQYAQLQFDNLHNAIKQMDPGNHSIANKVCIPQPACTLHVPSAYDDPASESLVNEIYIWALSGLGLVFENSVFLPRVSK